MGVLNKIANKEHGQKLVLLTKTVLKILFPYFLVNQNFKSVMWEITLILIHLSLVKYQEKQKTVACHYHYNPNSSNCNSFSTNTKVIQLGHYRTSKENSDNINIFDKILSKASIVDST